jgi:tetratricopeptide (TPR) repeat protein
MERIHTLKKKLEKHPNDVNILNTLGSEYETLNMLQEAIECYKNIVKYVPANFVALNQIGVCYFKMCQYKQAIDVFKQVIQMKDISDVQRNIGTCYFNLNMFKKSEKHTVLAYNLDPNKDENKSSLASLYYMYKQYDKSITFYKKMKTHTIEIAFPYLGKREFKTGFEYYELRLDKNLTNPQTRLPDRVEIPQLKQWKGEECKQLLIIYEQGIGDNIQYFRFILELARKRPTMKITYFCKHIVAHIFKHDLPNLRVATELNVMNYDYKTYIMSLPYLLKLDNINPNVDQYIKTDPDKFREWERQLMPLHKFRIGFTFNGLLLNTFIEKYIPLCKFLELCDLEVELICIHKKSEIAADMNALNCPPNLHFFDLDEEQPFVDTIHILQHIDLLITVDTCMVHLAGVLNVRTWLLLGKRSEWRWSDCDSCYWYNSVEIIRNTEDNLSQIIPVVKDKIKKLTEN